MGVLVKYISLNKKILILIFLSIKKLFRKSTTEDDAETRV